MGREGIRGLLSEEARRHGLELPAAALAALEQYVLLLADWSSRHRIVADGRVGTLVRLHVSDSLAWIKAVQQVSVPEGGRASALDVGTGAGLPGLVAALAWGGLDVLLCEVAQKRLAFLYWALQQLHTNAVVFAGSADEIVAKDEQFEHVVSRAFRSPAAWLDLASHLVSPGGWVWFMLTGRQEAPFAGGDYEYTYRLWDGRHRRVVGLRARL